ncbi:MAG: 4Fe-4S binding protein [Coriobacteriia bacterium]|nr:4Fe-4S binding protein [Coriobacteriia bacterium]
MAALGLLIDYEYCTGCHSCEVACQMEHGLPVGQYGIKVAEVGPWQIHADKWQFAYVPIPTEQCNLCGERVAKGKLPSCVHHCQASVMKYGLVTDLAKELEAKRQMVLFVP